MNVLPRHGCSAGEEACGGQRRGYGRRELAGLAAGAGAAIHCAARAERARRDDQPHRARATAAAQSMMGQTTVRARLAPRRKTF